MTFVLLTGALVSFLVTTLVAAVRRAPTRLRCPRCRGKTEAVQAPRWLGRSFVTRWCPNCSWEGIGRVGAEWVPGRPVSHSSGFHWGEERLPEDFGFCFAQREATQARAHPSGFNWADGR